MDMNAVVFLSSVCNPEEKLRIGGRGFEVEAQDQIANDFDLIALEKAILLKEEGVFERVTLFSVDADPSHILKGLAMGADDAVNAHAPDGMVCVGRVVETAVSHFSPSSDTVWFFGKLGVNFELSQCAQRFAARLGMVCLPCVKEMRRNGRGFEVTCEADGGMPTFFVRAPFAVTADLRLAQPRFPSLPNIVRARRKPVTEIVAESELKGYDLVTSGMALGGQQKRVCRWIDAGALADLVDAGAIG